jgi:Uma2 family endonuclease
MLDAMFDLSLLGSERIRPLRREEYDQLIELGCFADERVELIDGVLVAMTPQGAPHVYVIHRLTELLMPVLRGRATFRAQAPLALGDASEPEPDFAIVPHGKYADAHPTHALLVVEVADSSLRKDRILKGRLYARAGIPEYWIMNVSARCVEVYRAPSGGSYAKTSTHGLDDVLHPEAFPDIAVPVADLLP